MSTYDFSTMYTTLPHHLIKDKLIDLINRTFIRENTNIWLATKNLMYIIITIYGRVKKSVMPLFIFWIIFLSLLATASRLFAIARGFTSGFSSQLFMHIFIRALLFNQTQCGTITVN